jgi:hypothetical protein
VAGEFRHDVFQQRGEIEPTHHARYLAQVVQSVEIILRLRPRA